MRFVVLTFFFLFLIALACGVGAWHAYRWIPEWADQQVLLTEARIVKFPQATKLAALSQQLEARGLIDSALLFQIWTKYFSDYSRFQAGNYRFEGRVSPAIIAAKMIEGDTFVPVVFRYTIPEGYTLKQIVALLVENKVGTAEEFAALVDDSEFRESLGVKSSSLEGYIYPATYSFTTFPSPREALALPIQTFRKKLPPGYIENIGTKGLTLDQAVAMASLIELETPHDDERSLVSEVIWRRYKRGIPLAIDATIIYGIKDYKGNLTRKHLKDASNPYNSRIHAGLPPTPIGSPSLASLKAVLTPTDNGFLYYVLDVETGRHHFSKSLKEHNRYVRKLIRDTRARRKKDAQR